jgi:hypothetical protein
MKNILINRIDHLNFEHGKTIRSTQIIRATRDTVAKLSLSLSLYIYQTFTRRPYHVLIRSLESARLDKSRVYLLKIKFFYTQSF